MLVVTLGGTIAATGDGAVAPRLPGRDLVGALPGLGDVADVTVAEVARVPSGDLTVADLLEVAARVRAAREAGSAGAVVVQGTDTLDETAFALELLAGDAGPIVATGAMRPPGAPGADGPANLLAAVRFAASPQAQGLGAVVVMNDEVHAARWVSKTHASSLAAFASPGRGPVGEVIEGVARVWAHPAPLPVVATTAGSPVALVAAVLDADGRAVVGLAGLGFRAAVVEAFGVGHVPSAMVDALEALAREMPVAVATRTGAGRVHRSTYDFVGSEGDLGDRGLLSAGALSGPKACGLLSLLVGSGAARDEVERRFGEVVALV